MVISATVRTMTATVNPAVAGNPCSTATSVQGRNRGGRRHVGGVARYHACPSGAAEEDPLLTRQDGEHTMGHPITRGEGCCP
jgi:hypothetical protein